LDDVFCIAALAADLPLTILQCITPKLGFGRDTWAVPAEDITLVLKVSSNDHSVVKGLTMLQYVWASQVTYFPCSGFTKLCFLFFFLRIFPAENTHKIVYAFAVISMLYTFGFRLVIIFACKPISAVWTSWKAESKVDYCINQNRFYLVAAGSNIAIDIAIVLIPLPELLRLNLSW
jgi:hypothetical protein